MPDVFVRDLVWLTIRVHFDVAEIEKIMEATRSYRCCPPGKFVSLDGMDRELAAKIRRLLGDVIIK